MTLVPTVEPNYTDGADLPISVADFKEHSRVVDTDEDNLIESYLRAATLRAETLTQRSLGPYTFKLKLDAFPREQNNAGQCWSAPIELRMPPVVDVTQVRYRDSDGAWVVMVEDTDYELDLDSLPPRVLPAYQKPWPQARNYYNSVEVTYQAGYTTVPEHILQGIRLIAAAWYENREDISDRKWEMLPLPVSANSIFASKRVWRF